MAGNYSTPYGVIYCIEHRESGMRYIGQTVQSIKRRWAGHKKDGYCVRLHRAIKKYGESAFDIYELDTADSKDHLDALEDFYIRLFNTTDRSIGYNLRGGGSFGKHSEESRMKMSEKVRAAHARDPSIAIRQGNVWRGKTHGASAREKLRLANLGKKATPETVAKLSERRKQLWQDKQARDNMRQASIEARKSDDYKAKVGENTKRQWADPEQRQRLIEARKATYESGNAARKAAWADPEKRAARLAKLAATRERKRLEAQTI